MKPVVKEILITNNNIGVNINIGEIELTPQLENPKMSSFQMQLKIIKHISFYGNMSKR